MTRCYAQSPLRAAPLTEQPWVLRRRAMYRPWLDAGAKALQAIVGPMANAHTYAAGPPTAASSSERSPCSSTAFVSTLPTVWRIRLTAVGLGVDATISFTALPTVTQTTKPALIPVPAGALAAGPDLHTINSFTGTKATIQVLRSLMAEHGVQVLNATETGDPSSSAWTEVGEFDHRGHD